VTEETPELLWEADSTHPQQAKNIRQTLRQVMDPEIRMNIIELGLVREVSLSDAGLHLRMILTTPFCPYGPAMLEMARAKAEETAGVPTTIELGMEMWEPSMMENGSAADWGLL